MTLNALINNPNPRVKKVLSRELLDALSKEYAEDGTRKSVAPLAPPTASAAAPERARKRMRALQAQLTEQPQGLGPTPLRSEHFLSSREHKMFFWGHIFGANTQPSQASSTRLEARTAVTLVCYEAEEDESSLDVHAAQSAPSMEPAALAIETIDTEICDDDRDAAEHLLSLKHTSRTDFKKPRH